MAPKPAGRPATKDLPDQDALSACAMYADGKDGHPFDQLAGWPKNLVASKLAKLERRGLVRSAKILPAGRVVLLEIP